MTQCTKLSVTHCTKLSVTHCTKLSVTRCTKLSVTHSNLIFCPSVVCMKTLSKETSRRDFRKQNLLLLFLAQQTQFGHGLLIHGLSRSRVISRSQRPLPDNTQHSQQTDRHATSGIQTHNLSRRAVADLRLRPRGHCDRLSRMVNHRK